MSEGRNQPEFSSAYANYVLGLLFVVYVFNFLDRSILTILLDPIKAEFGVSDTAMGFLTGIAFAAFYTFAGIPIARWADHGPRRTIIAIGLAVWSAMTALSGLARSFAHLAAARIGVGVGEAAGSPPAHSLISDYFPIERRATALSIYNTGIYAGSMFGLLIGGWINEAFSWRTAFVVVGLPGILLAVLVRLTIREPPRAHSVDRSVDAGREKLGSVVRFLLSKKSFVFAATGAGIVAFTGYGSSAWNPAFVGRVHDMGSAEIGRWLGLIGGIAGCSGAVSGGLLADRRAGTDTRWYFWLPALATLLAVPLKLPFLFLDNIYIGFVFLFLSNYFMAMFLAPTLAALYSIVTPTMRALASAILLFIINIIGLGLGPQMTGVFNDLLSDRFGLDAVRYSLTIVDLTSLIGVGLYLMAARSWLAEQRGSRARSDAA